MPLVIAATPIGDPDDASPRLRSALAGADVIAAEDTRRLRRLLSALGIAGGGRLVAVSDAGMPLVSDPGYPLVAGAVARGLPITVVPGPSAVTAAVAVSGLPVDRWSFEGFLPRKAGERRSRLAQLADDRRALVLFESPRRVAATLAELATAFGVDRAAAVCRELTKTHEEVRRGSLAELAAWAGSTEVLGEVTIVVAGAPGRAGPVDPDALESDVRALVDGGMTRRDKAAEGRTATG
jgi:16S rRNA (cytidine1402-2'-O)-methyltransferase